MQALISVERIDAATCREEFRIALQMALGQFGCDFFIHTMLPNAHLRFEDAVSTNFWPPGWYDTYCERRFAVLDPVLRHCRSSSDPIDWAALGERGDPVMECARSHGMLKGFSVPIYGANGYAACFSASGTKAEVTEHTRPALHLIGIYADKLARSLEIAGKNSVTPLTAREAEVLTWAAVGKSCADTAEILSITQRTITAHTVNAMDKLGAANKTQAVVVALQHRLIAP